VVGDKNKKANVNLIFSIVATMMVFVTFVASSFAWFAIKDKAKTTFTAGVSNIVLYSATYQGESGSGMYVWDEGINLEEQEASFGREYLSPDYVTQLGMIDNLSFRSEMNNLWYCLRIDKTSGNNFSSLRLCFVDETPYKLFSDLEDTHGQVNDEVVNAKMDKLLDNLICMDSLIVSTVGIENFFSAESIPGVNENCSDMINVKKYSDEGAISFEGNVDDLELTDSKYYYLYFRAYPNLEAYADLVDEISNYMPCVIQFNLMISLVVDNKIN
jgi:hypothetical protein